MAQPKIFVSYSRKDHDITQRLVADLTKAGAEVWVDVDGIQSGNFMQAIDKALAKCDWMVLVLSPSALASEYVPEETYTALHRVKQGYMKAVIPILVTACQPGISLLSGTCSNAMMQSRITLRPWLEWCVQLDLDHWQNLQLSRSLCKRPTMLWRARANWQRCWIRCLPSHLPDSPSDWPTLASLRTPTKALSTSCRHSVLCPLDPSLWAVTPSVIRCQYREHGQIRETPAHCDPAGL